MSETILRKHLVFYGTVQGVGFRWRARQAAEAVGATGWVRNDRSGSVSMELQGTEAQIDRVIQSIENGLYIHVEGLSVEAVELKPDERGFFIRDDWW